MALAFPSFCTQKPKERTRVSTRRIEKEFNPPMRCKGVLPFNKLVVTPIFQNVAYAGYLDISFKDIVQWWEWELYDGLRAVFVMNYYLYIPKGRTKLISVNRLDGYQMFVILGQCAYNGNPGLSTMEACEERVNEARKLSLKLGKGWIIKYIKERCYQGRIMQTEEFMKVWEKELEKEKGDYPPF